MPNSVQIGNLQIPLKGLGPPGNLLLFGAELWETQHYWTGEEADKLAVGYFKAVERAVFDESFFRSMHDVFSAIDEPASRGARYIENIMSGFVPFSALQNQVGHSRLFGIDPYQKDIEPGVAGIFDAVRSRMIGVSRYVANRYDMFGEPVSSRGPRLEPYRDDPTAQWLNEVGVAIGRLDRSIATVHLTAQQFNDLARISGRLGKELLDSARDGLRGLPRGLQAKEIDRLLGAARATARAEVMMNSIGSSNDILQKATDKKLELLK